MTRARLSRCRPVQGHASIAPFPPAPASDPELASSYLLCATPRTGSSLLCGLLDSTGVAGHPESWFRWQDERELAVRWGIADPRDGAFGHADYFQAAAAAGSKEGLASARARGRTGGRPPVLSQVQLDQAQRMYDEDHLTVDEIAKAFRVGRSTLYESLAAYKDGGNCVLVVYRNTRPGKVDGSNRRYGETGQSEKVQLEADRKWWPVAAARQARLKGMVFVVNGIVARIRAVDPAGTWERDDRGYADIPLSLPLTEVQAAEQFPALGIRLGDPRPHVKGKIREYLPL